MTAISCSALPAPCRSGHRSSIVFSASMLWSGATSTSAQRSRTMPNLPDIIEIGYSRKRLLVLLAGGIVLTAGSAAMAFHLFPDMRVDAFYTAVGYFGVVFFGF